MKRHVLSSLYKLFYKIHITLFSEVIAYYIVKSTNLFDENYYRSQRKDLVHSNKPLWHFVRHGYKEGLSPCPLFDCKFYTSKYPDINCSFINPLIHFILFGDKEYRIPHPFFDTFFVYKKYSQSIPKGQTSLEYYVNVGIKEGKICSPILSDSLHVGDSVFINPSIFKDQECQVQLCKIREALNDNNIVKAVELFEMMTKDSVYISHMKKKVVKIDFAYNHGKTLYQEKSNHNGQFYGSFTYPKKYINLFNNVNIIGGSRYIYKDDTILHDEMSEFTSSDYGVKRWQILERVYDNEEIKGLLFNVTKKKNNVIDKGILISCDHDNNYFHWLNETLPMVVFALEHEEIYRDFPLLIPKKIHYNFKCALHVLLSQLKNNKKIIELEENEIYKVKQLVLPSDLSRILDRYHGDTKIGTDIILYPIYIKKVKELLQLSTNLLPPSRKIYLTRRSGTYRKVLNEEQIEICMLKRGYEVIDLAGVSFEYQQTIFAQAKIVVSPTGATMTNMILSPKNSVFVVLFSNHSQELPQMYNGHNIDLWSQLADICNIHLVEFFGQRAYHREDLHDDFVIDIPKLEKLLDKLEENS